MCFFVLRDHLIPTLLLGAALLFPRTALAQNVLLADDASVSSGAPTTNNGGAATMIIRGGAVVQRGFVQFDLSNLPAGTTTGQVLKAVLTVYVSSLGTAGSMNVVLVNAAWSERTITNANAPPTGAIIASGLPVATANKFVSADVTSAVQQWLSGAVPNNGLAIVANTPTTSFQIDTKENGASSHPAELSITLTGPQGAAGPTGPQGPQGAMGSAGPQGISGPQGAQGLAGSVGPPGPVGPLGPIGPPGATGPPGPQGPPTTFQGVWQQATMYNLGDAVFYNGSSYVSLVPGNTGNQPDQSQGQWALLAQQGATGPQGVQGLTGAMGPPGPQGTQGVGGATGPQGPQGLTGPQGSTGSQGPEGPSGPQGPAGPSHVHLYSLDSYLNIPLGSIVQVGSLNLPGPGTYLLTGKVLVGWAAPYFSSCYLLGPAGISSPLDFGSTSVTAGDSSGTTVFNTIFVQSVLAVPASGSTVAVDCTDYNQPGSPPFVQIQQVRLSALLVDAVN